MSAPLPLSVIVRTIGRPSLEACLASLARCDPPAAEVVVVDQSAGDMVAGLVARHARDGVRSVRTGIRGRASSANTGLRAARNDDVMFTDDDCTVAVDWVATGAAHLAAHPRGMVTGRIEPVGDRRAVPVVKLDPQPRDFTGDPRNCEVIACNLACRRPLALAIGGFDELMEPTMEDWDFGYRWVSAGLELRYDPALAVWHHDWRAPAELRRTRRDYGVGVGRFYAKLALRRDPNVVVFLVRDLRRAAWALRNRRLDDGRAWEAWRVLLGGLARGLPGGLRDYRRRRAT